MGLSSYDPSCRPLSDTDLLGLGVRSCAEGGRKAVETALAAVTEDDERLVAELADLWFRSNVLLGPRGLDVRKVEEELARRACSLASPSS